MAAYDYRTADAAYDFVRVTGQRPQIDFDPPLPDPAPEMDPYYWLGIVRARRYLTAFHRALRYTPIFAGHDAYHRAEDIANRVADHYEQHVRRRLRISPGPYHHTHERRRWYRTFSTAY